LKRSAIILAGGPSKRFGRDKALIKLSEKTLIRHVFDKVVTLVDKVFVVVSSKEQLEEYSKIFDPPTRIVLDEIEVRSPLVGAITGFKSAASGYSMLLPCDTPLISEKVLSLMLNLVQEYDAVVPRWPSGYIEPLQSAYKTKTAYASAVDAFKKGELNLRSMISRLKNVLYFSTVAIQSIDPDLHTFFNVNNADDLMMAELVISRMKNEHLEKRQKTFSSRTAKS
jgi:molybdopterin-guanine dinucleotide biosynthesis protein A